MRIIYIYIYSVYMPNKLSYFIYSTQYRLKSVSVLVLYIIFICPLKVGTNVRGFLSLVSSLDD